jgi:hypothetical protein
MNEKIVLILSAFGANDAIHGLMVDYGCALTEAGLSVLHVSLQGEVAEVQYAVDLMAKGEVAFALTWLGIGQGLSDGNAPEGETKNIFERFGVPLVKLQGDLPAYFPARHRDVPGNSVNLYQAQEFVEYRRRWLPEARSLASLIPPMAMNPIERKDFKTARRGGQLVFAKNGNSTEKLREVWQTKLPSSTSQLAMEMSEAILQPGLKPGPLLIGDFVADFLKARGLGGDIPRDIIAFFAAQMDDFLRRAKSTMIAEAILDLPIIVQGSFWDHVDFSGKRARLVEGKDVDSTQRMLTEQLGAIDMSANVDTWPHDRVQRAAGSFALALTNHQTWLNHGMAGFEDLTFEFSPESINARVADAISRPDRYLELAVSFGEAFRVAFPRSAFAQKVMQLVDVASLMWNEPKPTLQPYYVWPNYH